jgi:hypothetical protein
MKRIVFAAAAVCLLAGTSVASAQVRDYPPGYAGRAAVLAVEDSLPYRGYGPYGYGYRAYGAYDPGAYYSYGSSIPGAYLFRPDDPPGSRYQSWGNNDDMGYDR